MDMIPVSSSRMNAIGWEANTLYIKFRDGALYAYDNVSLSEYNAFRTSSSLGSALSQLDKIHTYHKIH